MGAIICSCTLSYKKCHLSLLCLQHHFGTILTIFAKFKYYFDFDKLAITPQPSRNEELCPFPVLVENYPVLQLLWCEKSQSSWRYFHVFPYQYLISFFSIWWKEEHQQLITYHKLNELFLVEVLINVRKKCHFWRCSIAHSFVAICDIYLENSLLNFYFGFDIEKTIPFIFLHFLLCLSYKITNHLLNVHELEYASFYHCRKWYPILFVVKNWYSILIENINKSVQSVLRHRILNYFTGNFFQSGISSYNQIISSQHIPPRLPGHLFCFLLMLKRQCIRVWLWKLVRCANKWSYRYWILFLDK